VSRATRSRPIVAGAEGGVSTGHPLASLAAIEILKAGGNAADAGCAAGMALSVLQPDIVSFAGVAPIMYRPADGREIATIDGLGYWPAGLPHGHFMSAHGGHIPLGLERCVIPAAPRAWITCLKLYGSMSFKEVASAAIHYARDGFAMYPFLSEGIGRYEADYRSWPTSTTTYLPQGKRPVNGEIFRQANLASAIQYMADEEDRAAGRREERLEAAAAAFYKGDIAISIDRFFKENGGLMRYSDLAEYQCRVEPAILSKFENFTLATCGPWCQGPGLAQVLRILEDYELGALGHNSPDYIHVLVEALKCAFSDREHFYADPAQFDVPIEYLLSKERAGELRALIDTHHAMPDMPGPDLTADSRSVAPQAEQDTSYAAVVDRFGNAFSATPSDGTNTAPLVPEIGMVVSTRGSQSRPDPNHHNGAVAGRRPRLTPSPAMTVSATEVMPFGTPGGDVQPQAMLQVLLNRRVFGMDVQTAVEAPRFATFSFPSSFAPFNHAPGLLMLEDGIAPSTARALGDKGHRIENWGHQNWLAGGVCAVVHNTGNGVKFAGADPRRECYALAY
jgi:gamma-glutamyltranspeptidase/glutathione hydrolase